MDQLSLFDPLQTATGQAVTKQPDELPRVAVELIEVMGLNAALQLINEWGGRRLIVPGWPLRRQSGRFQFLEDIVGHEAAVAFAIRWGDQEIQVPMCRHAMYLLRVRECIAAYDAGTKVPELAGRYRTTESTIWKWLKVPTTQGETR